MRKVVDLAVIENRRILLVKKNLAWLLPGGKPMSGESDEDCLERELSQKLSGTKFDHNSLRFYGTFEGLSPHKKDVIKVDVYSAKLQGVTGKPSGEISDSVWLGAEKFGEYLLSEATSKVVKSLCKDGYL